MQEVISLMLNDMYNNDVGKGVIHIYTSVTARRGVGFYRIIIVCQRLSFCDRAERCWLLFITTRYVFVIIY